MPSFTVTHIYTYLDFGFDGLLCCFGGQINKGEKPYACLVREVNEEFNDRAVIPMIQSAKRFGEEPEAIPNKDRTGTIEQHWYTTHLHHHQFNNIVHRIHAPGVVLEGGPRVITRAEFARMSDSQFFPGHHHFIRRVLHLD